MREHTKQPYRTCTRLFGKQNPLNLMMFGCWGIVVVGHNILSLMKEFKKKSNFTTSICGKLQSDMVDICRIGDTCLTSLATIGGNLFTRHTKNINHAYKDSKNLLSVIIILGTDVHCVVTVFNDEENMNDIGKISHVPKHSHGRCVVGPFDKILYKGSIWTGHRAILSLILHKSIFFTFYIMVQYFMTNISHRMMERNIRMMMGVMFLQSKRLESYTMQNIKRII